MGIIYYELVEIFYFIKYKHNRLKFISFLTKKHIKKPAGNGKPPAKIFINRFNI